MKVENMTSRNGNKVANQFVITSKDGANTYRIFQSYDSIIVKISTNCFGESTVQLDTKYWNYSKTTAKYRNEFLGETTEETQSKIDKGEYILTNLN